MLYNRDLSWLGFNYRVLQEAANKTVPLFERLKFLAIFSSNLDEFFRVRYPSVFAFSKLNRKTQQQVSIGLNEELPDKIQTEINRQLNHFGSILTGEIIPELKETGIIFYYNSPIRPEHTNEIREIFLSKVLSFIQPLYLESEIGKAFSPENNQLYLVVVLKEADIASFKHAIINIPSDKLNRFFELTPLDGNEYVIFIDDIIRENLDCLFPGFEIAGVYSVKFNRDSELHLDEEYSGDLLGKIEKQLKKRDFGPPSRFLYEGGMPRNIQLFLASTFGVQFEEMFAGSRYHHLSNLSSFPTFNKNLNYEKRRPLATANLMACGDIFNILNQQDVLLHIPYQSYNPVLSFFNQAAVDINVTDIFITLYRVAAESHIVNALISAAKNGKRVTAFVELKARFDEANNIKWGRKMKDAGIRIIYSIPHIKVHSKIALIQKRSGADTLSYAILSTGNFNEITAQFYTDHVLMTTDLFIIKELLQLFRFLQKTDTIQPNNKLKFDKLLVSQFNMNERFEKLIDDEIQKAMLGEPAEIRIKVNNLEEPHMISLLYKASQAGVNVKLCIRSICCLMPGVPGISENITVRRLVDRYLEHTRLFIFGAGNDAEVIMGSSDWMTRNLYHRIEVCVSIKNITCKHELIDYFEMQWRDNDKAVELSPNLEQRPVVTTEQENFNAQTAIYHYLQNRL
ncbi:polyphosphate kinase 1 [Segetibacter sp. 3557_3]|uniref:polyphosphate kinase 1 n=1 Tax=Segetibacter sp. 3557_3 TaxID=2547429 RepID=UPI001058B673|nr:polyphosphate kinase 1 [Segetibacter sp. 3557_3]TDH25100.1 polyphosphate kinase 1 [Segetibacter sp. 3557_3]